MIPSGRKPDHFSVDFRAQMGIMDGIEAKECRRGLFAGREGGKLREYLPLFFCFEKRWDITLFFVVKNDGILLWM